MTVTALAPHLSTPGLSTPGPRTPDSRAPGSPWVRMMLPALGLGCGVALAALLFSASGTGPSQAAPAPALPAPALPAPDTGLVARVAQLEASLARVADAAARAEATAADLRQAQALRGPQGERFVAAALLLQASIATPRPWIREYQAMAALAPEGALPAPLVEVLVSHAARGLPTEADLRERFVALAPQLAARAPRQGDAFDSTLGLLRGAAAGIGLAAPPPPSDQEQAIAGVAQHLRRGNLAAAVADASALDPGLQPLLAGWLAQARARLAVEQAVQETLLRALSRAAPPI